MTKEELCVCVEFIVFLTPLSDKWVHLQNWYKELSNVEFTWFTFKRAYTYSNFKRLTNADNGLNDKSFVNLEPASINNNVNVRMPEYKKANPHIKNIFPKTSTERTQSNS